MEVYNMITVEINKDFMNALYFDALHNKNRLTKNGEKYSAEITMDEYDQFMKDNNLIPYKNLLKQYEDGEIVGSFTSTQ